MLTFNGPDADIQLCLTLAAGEAGRFSRADLQRVADGVADEDMRHVSAEDLARSYAMYGAYDIDGEGQSQIVGFMRQVERNFIETQQGRIALSELGTVWVEPDYRGRKIGAAMIAMATSLMDIVEMIPIGVCNSDGAKAFDAAGYATVGQMTCPDDGNKREVKMFYPNNNGIRGIWEDGLKQEVLSQMQRLPRFGSMILTS